jgi:hypothetical protein
LGVNAFEIFAVIFLGLVVVTTVYAIARFVWRLREGDIEPAGSDGRAITGKD